jgi:hypothetical protein
MAGLGPAIHVFGWTMKQDVDARDKPGHDGEKSSLRGANGSREMRAR